MSSNYDGRDALQQLRLHFSGGAPADEERQPQNGLERIVQSTSKAIAGAWQKTCDAYNTHLDANDNAWWLFARTNRVRQLCLRICAWPWFGRIILTLVLASCLVMALDDPGCTDACKQEAVLTKVVSPRCNRCDMYKKASVVLDLFFTTAFTIEIIIKSIGHNFCFGPDAYLKSGWNWIDFLSTASGYLRYLPISENGGLSGIRAMRALRPLRALNAIPGLRMLVETLLEAVPLLIDVLMLLTWVFFVFGIVALNLFMGKLHNRCMIQVDPSQADANLTAALSNLTAQLLLDNSSSSAAPPPLLQPSWPPPWPPPVPLGANGSGNGDNASELVWVPYPGMENTVCSGSGPGILKCPDGATCLDTNTNPNYGYTSFDNFAAASYCIFQMLTLDAWTSTLLYPLMNSIGPALPVLYFTLLVLFGAFFAMQLLVAILSSKFAQLSAQRPKKRKKRRRRRAHTPPDTTDEDNDDCESDPDDDGQPRRCRLRIPPLGTRLRRWWRRNWYHFHRTYLMALRRKDLPPWRAFFWDVTYSIWFNNIMTGFILANTVTLGLEHYGMGDAMLHTLEIINLALTAGFILEFVVKHLGCGIVGYWRDPWNILDGLIVVLSIVEIILTYGPASGGGTNTQSLRTFRLLRILRSLKLLARVKALRKLMRMVIKGFVALKDFLMLLVLFIFIFSILGLQQFGGAAAFAPAPPAVGYNPNFDTLWQSGYTVFQLLTSDSWVSTSWTGMLARGTAACLYFITWIVIGNFVLLTLFLAILITNFQSDEDVEPTEEELNSNPYAPDDQSETASTLGGSTLGGEPGSNGPQNALGQRVVGRTQEKDVYAIKKWMVLMGYYHGMKQAEVSDISMRMDDMFTRNQGMFAPFARTDIVNYDERDQARERERERDRDSTNTATSVHGSPGPGAGHGGRSSALRRVSNPLSAALSKFGAQLQSISSGGPVGDRERRSNPETSVPLSPAADVGPTGGTGFRKFFGGKGGGGGEGGSEGKVLGRRSAPLSRAVRNTSAEQPGVGPQMRPMDTVAEEGEQGVNATVSADVTGDRVNPGRMLPSRPGDPRALRSHRSAQVRDENRPTLMTVQTPRSSLPTSVAAALEAVRTSLRANHVSWRPSDSGLEMHRVESGVRLDTGRSDGQGHGRGHGHSRSHDHDHDHEAPGDEVDSPSPMRRRREFVEQWRTWFDDAESAPASSFTASGVLRTGSTELKMAAGVGLPRAASANAASAAAAAAAAAVADRANKAGPAESAHSKSGSFRSRALGAGGTALHIRNMAKSSSDRCVGGQEQLLVALVASAAETDGPATPDGGDGGFANHGSSSPRSRQQGMAAAREQYAAQPAHERHPVQGRDNVPAAVSGGAIIPSSMRLSIAQHGPGGRLKGITASSWQQRGRSLPRCWSTSQMDGAHLYSESAGAYVADGYAVGLPGSSHPSPQGSVSRVGRGSGVPSSPRGPESISDLQPSSRGSPQRRGRAGASAAGASVSPASSSVSPTRGGQPQSTEAASGLLTSATSLGVTPSAAGTPDAATAPMGALDGIGYASSRERPRQSSSHPASTLILAPPTTVRGLAAAADGGSVISPPSAIVLKGGDCVAETASSSDSLPGVSVLNRTVVAQRGSPEVQGPPTSRMAWASPSASASKLAVQRAPGPASHQDAAPGAREAELGSSSALEGCSAPGGEGVDDRQPAMCIHGSHMVLVQAGAAAASSASRAAAAQATAQGRVSGGHSVGSNTSFAFTSQPESYSSVAQDSMLDTRRSPREGAPAASAAESSLQDGWVQPQPQRSPVAREPLIARHLCAAAAAPTMTTMTATPTALAITAAETFGAGNGADIGDLCGDSFLSRESFAFTARSPGQGSASGSGSGSLPSPNYFGPYVRCEQPPAGAHGVGGPGVGSPAAGMATGAGALTAGEPGDSTRRVCISGSQHDSQSLASTSCASWLPAVTTAARPSGPPSTTAGSHLQAASSVTGSPTASRRPVAEGVMPSAMDPAVLQLVAVASPGAQWPWHAEAYSSSQKAGDWWRPAAAHSACSQERIATGAEESSLVATRASGPVAEAIAMASSISAERRARARQRGANAQPTGAAVPDQDPYPYLKFSAFIFLAPYHPYRMKMQAVVSNKWFEGFIMLMILISSITLALDRPTLDPASSMAEAVKIIEWTINILFAIEMIIKLLLKGCIWHRSAYWRNGWDILDGLIVVTSLVSMAAPSIAFFRTLRLLRVLRPLRMVSRVRGMRMVVETLITSLPAVANVMLFGGFMFGIFGILGTQLYMGRTSRCNQNSFANGTAVLDKSMCMPGVFICTDSDICDTIGEPTTRTWVTPYRNFDHLGRSLLTLFIVATLDGYMDTLQAVVDAVGVDKQPQYNHAPYMGMYVISFVFLGSFFWLNLLVSVIIDYYSQLMMKEEGMLADKSMREWMKLLQFTARPQKDIWRTIPVPKNPLRARCYGIASSPYFDNFIMSIIMANVLVMALPHEGSTPTFEDTLAFFNAAFTLVFIFEAVVKNMAMGPRVYIKDNWNKLDLFIVITSIPDLLSLVVPLGAGTGVMTVFRIMRIGRMFKLIKNARGLRTLFNTLISSLPAIVNVGSLLFLLMFIYAVLGMNLFGTPGNPFEGGTDSNFNNFGASLVVLFQVFTGDGWSAVMAQASGCDSFQFQCKTSGQALVAALFFCSFIMLANFVMLNLVIAVILDNFITSAKDEGLLTISNFSETMSKVISLRIFVRLLKTKIELMKAVDELKAFANHNENGGHATNLLLTRDRRAKSRKKPSAVNIPLVGVLGKQGEASPASTAGGIEVVSGPTLGRIGTGLLGAAQGRNSHLSIPSRDEGHSVKRSDSRDATNNSSYFGAIRRALTRQESSEGGDGVTRMAVRAHGGTEGGEGDRSHTASMDGGVGGTPVNLPGLSTILRRRRISGASDV